jgi:hypothetical protein
MKSGAVGLADEVIRTGDGLVRFMSQVFTPENGPPLRPPTRSS